MIFWVQQEKGCPKASPFGWLTLPLLKGHRRCHVGGREGTPRQNQCCPWQWRCFKAKNWNTGYGRHPPPIFGRFGFFVDPVKTKRGGSSPLSANPHAGSFANLPRCDRAAGTESGTLRMGASPVQSPKSAAGRRPKL